MPERDLWIAEWQARRDTCGDCGLPIDECSDPERKFYPYRTVCYATMEREAAQEAYSALHEDAGYHDGTFTRWAKDRSASHPYAFGAGVTIRVARADVAPWDLFTTKRDASPVPLSADSVAEEPPGKQHDADDQGGEGSEPEWDGDQ